MTLTELVEGALGVGSVEQPTPANVLDRSRVDRWASEDDLRHMYHLASTDPPELARYLDSVDRPKVAAAVRSSIGSSRRRDERHRANVEQTLDDIARDAGGATRTGLPVVALLGFAAAALYLGSSR